MSRGLAKLLSVISVIVLLVLVFIFAASKNQVAMYIAMAIWFVLYSVLMYFQRCPHCGAWPRKGSFFDEFCPRCGGNLDE